MTIEDKLKKAKFILFRKTLIFFGMMVIFFFFTVFQMEKWIKKGEKKKTHEKRLQPKSTTEGMSIYMPGHCIVHTACPGTEMRRLLHDLPTTATSKDMTPAAQ